MRLLIIEDEQALHNALRKGFEKSGYAVDTAMDGEAALECFYSASYDVIILDLNLPKMDGLEVLEEIRKEDRTTNVLVLSARSEVEDKITGLDLGANDYLAKPFSFKELHARVRALSRRDYEVKDNAIKIGDITLDMTLKKVKVKDKTIALTKKEYGILEYLMVNRGKVISAEAIFEHVWDSSADMFSNAFKVHLASLRKKLPKNFIKTRRGEGYYVE